MIEEEEAEYKLYSENEDNNEEEFEKVEDQQN